MASKNQRLEDEKEFYGTMDRVSNGSCCTCTTLTLFFIILSIIAVYGIYWLSNKQLSKINPQPRIPKVSVSSITLPKKDNVKDGKLVITDNDLQKIIWGKSKILIPISDKKARIEAEGLILSGRMTGNSQTIEVIAKPVVNNEKVEIEDISIRSGPTSISDKILTPVKETASKAINDEIAKYNSKPVKNIALTKGKMTISFTR